MLNTVSTAGDVIALGEGAVARLLSDGRWEVTQGEVGSYRYRRLLDRETLAAGYAAWESCAPRDETDMVQIAADTWADYEENHISFDGGAIEMVEGFGSRVGLVAEDVKRLMSATAH